MPDLLANNKQLWFRLLLESPKLQEFQNTFNQELDKILKTEMTKNKDILEMYMLYPHKYKKPDLVNRYQTKRKDDPAGDTKFEQLMINQSI